MSLIEGKGRARLGGSKLHIKTILFMIGIIFIIHNISKKYKDIIFDKDNRLLVLIISFFMILYIDDYFKNKVSDEI